ncbi:hypothetical protein GGH92_001496, partial [Coemansia sp. RSA 2673]
MSTIVSPAQAPPSDVLRLVMQHLLKGSKLRNGITVERKDVIKELLYVCSEWRQGALEYMWRTLSLTIDDMAGMIYVNNPSFAEEFMLPANASEIVRELNITVSMSSIVSGKAYKLLSGFMGAATTLPLACKLFIMIMEYSLDPDFVRKSAIDNALEFAYLLQSITLTPAMSTEVKYIGSSFSISEHIEDIFGMFVNRLGNNS